jgi:cytochrome c oxidase subunit 2
MKTLFKLFAIAAAIAVAPAMAGAQAPAASPASESISAASQASPAQPAAVSDPAVANIGTEAPSDATVANATMASRATPTPGIGQPDGRIGFQDQVTDIGREAARFHNWLLMPIITAISVFVLGLLLWVIVRFRRGAHPVPSRTTHNTTLEVVWTLVPVLILVAIAIPSIDLLRAQYSPPKADLTIKVTGNQWYWTYAYPDNGDFEIVSNMLSEKDAKARGEPRLLGVDERMVVPVNKTVKVIVTAADVIHSWGVPAFWVKMDAVPGRLNETWFKADRPGLYYGQCFELCGARHAYMPIAVEVVTDAQFAAWVASKGGPMGGKAASSDATANSPVTNPAPAAPAPLAGGTAAGASPTTPGTGTPPVSSQSAATSSEKN